MTASNRDQTEGPKLALVSDLAPLYDLGRKPASTAERVRRLQAEARMLAREQVGTLEQQIRAVLITASEIAQGGDAYPAGVRDQAERMVTDLEGRIQGVRMIMDRTPEPKL